ncbi:MAG: asparagine synthase-related protein, partial [Phenylobacterium sp.]
DWLGEISPAVWQFWGPRAKWGPAPPRHPWLRDLDDTPPGKQVQIRALLGTHEFWGRSRRSRAAQVVQPLLAQPIVELCLGAPTWNLLEGGRDRALARRAFAEDLPPEVAQRRSKGMLNTLYARRTAASLPFLRAHLLEGVLADAGVLDREAVDAALTPEQLIWRDDGARLSRAAMMESWVRYWQGRIPDLASAPRTLQSQVSAESLGPIGQRA